MEDMADLLAIDIGAPRSTLKCLTLLDCRFTLLSILAHTQLTHRLDITHARASREHVGTKTILLILTRLPAFPDFQSHNLQGQRRSAARKEVSNLSARAPVSPFDSMVTDVVPSAIPQRTHAPRLQHLTVVHNSTGITSGIPG